MFWLISINFYSGLFSPHYRLFPLLSLQDSSLHRAGMEQPKFKSYWVHETTIKVYQSAKLELHRFSYEMQMGKINWIDPIPKAICEATLRSQNVTPTNQAQEPLTSSWLQWSHNHGLPLGNWNPSKTWCLLYLISIYCNWQTLKQCLKAFPCHVFYWSKPVVALYFRQTHSIHITSSPAICLFLVHSTRLFIMLNVIQVKAWKFICCCANWGFMSQNWRQCYRFVFT